MLDQLQVKRNTILPHNRMAEFRGKTIPSTRSLFAMIEAKQKTCSHIIDSPFEANHNFQTHSLRSRSSNRKSDHQTSRWLQGHLYPPGDSSMRGEIPKTRRSPRWFVVYCSSLWHGWYPLAFVTSIQAWLCLCWLFELQQRLLGWEWWMDWSLLERFVHSFLASLRPKRRSKHPRKVHHQQTGNL